MGKIIDSIEAQYASSDEKPTVSFEYFPAKTEDGIYNLLTRIEGMSLSLQPTFVTLTWRSAFKDESLWLRIGAHIQKEFQLDVLLHLTCHLPVEDLKRILKNARAAGIRNILALRGDPPIGSERWQKVEGGLSNAVDLIRLIRQEHGDYFCIACAGYPEVHIESWNHPDLPPSKEAKQLDLERLKEKQDAGADFLITQFFFDVDNMLRWIQDCRDVGITMPILPGYLPIQNYNAFRKFTSWTKTSVPKQISHDLEKIKNDDAAVKKYGIQLAIDTCQKMMNAGVKSLHFYTMNLASTVTQVLNGLDLVPSPHQRSLPWNSTLARTNGHGDGEQVRPIFWSNRQASYIARTSEWDDFPNGRWGDRSSPAYGELSDYYLNFKRKVNRHQLWGTPSTHQEVYDVFVDFVEGKIKQLPWCEQTLAQESGRIRNQLKWINSHGFLTINSQPRVNATPSNDPAVGWGGDDGVVFQKAYVEFFVSPSLLDELLKMFPEYPSLSFHALDRHGNEHSNVPKHSVTAVTWGVFPGREIIQPTVVDSDSFDAWKDEAFELWQAQWLSAYEEGSASHKVLSDMIDTYFLVNVVDNDYTNDASDIFHIFSRIIADGMSKDDLRARMVELQTLNEHLHESVGKLQVLQDEMAQELSSTHAELERLKNDNVQLRNETRKLRARAAISTL